LAKGVSGGWNPTLMPGLTPKFNLGLNMNKDRKFYNLPEVLEITRLKPETLTKLTMLRNFPKPALLGKKLSLWRGEDIHQWMDHKFRW
jgi:predicted DNA-binding transcriptional regulator AlpA